jgi:hypothetical protein
MVCCQSFLEIRNDELFGYIEDHNLRLGIVQNTLNEIKLYDIITR